MIEEAMAAVGAIGADLDAPGRVEYYRELSALLDAAADDCAATIPVPEGPHRYVPPGTRYHYDERKGCSALIQMGSGAQYRCGGSRHNPTLHPGAA